MTFGMNSGFHVAGERRFLQGFGEFAPPLGIRPHFALTRIETEMRATSARLCVRHIELAIQTFSAPTCSDRIDLIYLAR